MIVATVAAVSGKAWAKDADGNLRLLQEGDVLRDGETVVTADGARVSLVFDDGRPATELVDAMQVRMTAEIAQGDGGGDGAENIADPEVAALIAAIEAGEGDLLEALEAPAAGDAGGGAGAEGGSDFVRLLRIVEQVSPLSYEYGVQRDSVEVVPQDGGGAAADVDEPVTLSGLDGPSGAGPDTGGAGSDVGFAAVEQTVSEANLPGGSAPDAAGLTRNGSFSFTSPDGLGALSIGDSGPIGLDRLNDLSTNPLVIDTALGTLILTGFSGSESGGTVSYSYVLNDNVDNDSTAGATDDGVVDSIAITVTDSDGSSATGSLDIAIEDDVPTAIDDATETDENAAVTYNVLTNVDGSSDIQGADDASLTRATLRDPSQGSVAIDTDTGEVTFTPADGFEGDAVIDYTITDGDGDTSDAVFTVTVAEDSEPTISVPDTSPGTAGGQFSVSESGLEGGSAEGSNSQTTTGTLAITTGGDTLQSLVINGVNVTAGGTVDGDYGTLTVTESDGEYSWSYTLDGNTEDHTEQGTGADGLQDAFAITVTDSDTDTAESSLTIQVQDDVPTAVDDRASVAEDSGQAITGNVLTNDTRGADSTDDQPASVALDAPAETGEYGTLTLDSDGSWSYQLDNSDPRVQALSGDETLTETFTYTLTDADGDTSPATLTITVNATDDGVSLTGLASEGSDVAVNEANLANGSEADSAALTQTGSFAFTSVDGVASVRVGDQSLTLSQMQGLSADAPVVVDTPYGVLTLTGFEGDAAGGTVSYSYTLDTRVDNDSQEGAGDTGFTETVALVVTDDNGSEASGNLSIAIADDAPEATADANAISEETATVGGNVIEGAANDAGADTLGADQTTVTAVSSDNESANT
ncbi:retention module-containing protein, partial [Halomonas sp. V046]|uniref:retention module-containing protein n=1 Tax=Halomonas sp. V046 TaxID=3459611 RepID=UPI0040450DDC